eukprot:1158855-Pelagomonas_calceolata.AAC.6
MDVREVYMPARGNQIGRACGVAVRVVYVPEVMCVLFWDARSQAAVVASAVCAVHGAATCML